MKTSQIALQKLLALTFALGIVLVVLEGEEPSANEMIGAKVYGPARMPVGDVVAVLKHEGDGSPLMYVVDADGIFDGKGIIPLSNVRDEVPVPQKGGGTEYELLVGINRATFKNIANWDSDETLASYLSRQSSMMGTLFGLEERMLDEMADAAVYDDGSGKTPSGEGLAGL